MRRPTSDEQPFQSADRTAHVFERMGLDAAVWRVVSVAVVGYVGLALAGVLVGKLVVAADGALFDEAAFMATLSADRSTFMTDASALFGRFSDTWTVIGMASGAIIVLSLSRLNRQIVVLGVGLALELSTYLTITYLVDRPRPAVDATAALPSTPSFPSGHVAAAVVLYGGLAIVVWSLDASRSVRTVAVAVAVVIPTLVGVSRVYEGLHYPTDVVAGAALGVSCLVVAATAAGHVATATAPDDTADSTRPTEPARGGAAT